MTFIDFLEDEVGMIKFKGVFDLTGMLRMMYSYIKHRGYDFYETKHKAKPPELELTWRAEKKVTAYEKYIIVIDFHFYDLYEVELSENNLPKKMTDGRFSIVFGGGIDRGYQKGTWNDKESPISEKLMKFYEKITHKEWMLNHADKLTTEVVELRDKTNSYLGMVASY